MSVRCGLRSNARQILPIVDADEPGALGHLGARPVRRVLRHRLQRRDHDVLDLLGGDRRRAPRPRIIREPVQPQLAEPPAPLPDRRRRHPTRHRDIRVRAPLRTRAERSANATPTLGRTSCAAPTAPAAHARDRSTPAPAWDVQFSPCHSIPHLDTNLRRGTLAVDEIVPGLLSHDAIDRQGEQRLECPHGVVGVGPECAIHGDVGAVAPAVDLALNRAHRVAV